VVGIRAASVLAGLGLTLALLLAGVSAARSQPEVRWRPLHTIPGILDVVGPRTDGRLTYLGDTDPDTALGPLRAAACTYRIALGPRAGQKVLSLQTLPTEPPLTPVGCVNAQGFSLHAEVCCAAHERKQLEHVPGSGSPRIRAHRADESPEKSPIPDR
jgi:hypothetical protein